MERSKDIVRPTRPPPSTASSLVLAEEKQAACCESRAAEFSRRPAGLLPTAPVCQPHPVGLLQQGNGLLSRESAPFSRTSIIVDENADSSAAWNWRRRVDASNGESGGRDVQCDGDNHGSRAAALNHRHSSFCYTCCPYAAYLAQNSVERSDERLNQRERYINK